MWTLFFLAGARRVLSTHPLLCSSPFQSLNTVDHGIHCFFSANLLVLSSLTEHKHVCVDKRSIIRDYLRADHSHQRSGVINTADSDRGGAESSLKQVCFGDKVNIFPDSKTVVSYIDKILRHLNLCIMEKKRFGKKREKINVLLCTGNSKTAR